MDREPFSSYPSFGVTASLTTGRPPASQDAFCEEDGLPGQVLTGDRRLLRHPPVAVGRTGRAPLEQAEYTMYARHAIERGDDVHLARAGIGEADIAAGREQRADQGFQRRSMPDAFVYGIVTGDPSA